MYSRRHSIERSVASVCLSVCLSVRALKIHGSPSVCTDPDVKRSRSKVKVKVEFFFNVYIGSVVDVDMLQSLAATVDGRSTCRPNNCDVITSSVPAAGVGAARQFDCQY